MFKKRDCSSCQRREPHIGRLKFSKNKIFIWRWFEYVCSRCGHTRATAQNKSKRRFF